jgi:hypothetical protein
MLGGGHRGLPPLARPARFWLCIGLLGFVRPQDFLGMTGFYNFEAGSQAGIHKIN